MAYSIAADRILQTEHEIVRSVRKLKYFVNSLVLHVFSYKKPSSRPSTGSFLTFSHILVLKVS